MENKHHILEEEIPGTAVVQSLQDTDSTSCGVDNCGVVDLTSGQTGMTQGQ